MRLPRSILPARLAAAVLVGGCAVSDTASPEPQTWTLAAEPDLVIGEDGTPEGELNRVVTVLPLPGGELAVADAGDAVIKVFSGTGEYQRSIGRRGAGPGEFQSIAWVMLEGDTLVVHDLGARRITLIGADGTVHATVIPRPEGPTVSVFPTTRSANGNWVVTANFGLAQLADQDAPPPSGVFRDTMGIGLLPASGSGPVNFILRVPAQPTIGVEGMIGSAVFSARVRAVRVGQRIAVADPESATLRWFAADGRGETEAILAIPRRPLDLGALDSLRRAAVERTSSPRARMMVEAMHSSAAAPSYLPVFSNALADRDDQLWLEEWTYDAPNPTRYHVVDAEGAWLATVDMPPGFRALTIGPDWVLGVHRDEDGVQRVMRYRLERS